MLLELSSTPDSLIISLPPGHSSWIEPLELTLTLRAVSLMLIELPPLETIVTSRSVSLAVITWPSLVFNAIKPLPPAPSSCSSMTCPMRVLMMRVPTLLLCTTSAGGVSLPFQRPPTT